MKRVICLCVFLLVLFSSCAEQGRIEVLTPQTGEGTKEETRRVVEGIPQTEPSGIDDAVEWIVNIKSGKFHADADCTYVKTMLEENKQTVRATARELMEEGKSPCSRCAKAYVGMLMSESQAQ